MTTEMQPHESYTYSAEDSMKYLELLNGAKVEQRENT